MKILYVAIAMILFTLLCPRRSQAQCSELIEGRTDYELTSESRAIHSKKVEYARAIINDKANFTARQHCAAKALFFLGLFKDTQTIPRMIELLDFEEKIDNPMHARTRNEQYPAVAGLAGMGKVAVPLSVKVIATSQSSLVRENAMYALMTIYQSEPGQGVDVLNKAAKAEQEPDAAMHLRDSASKAESIWCKYPAHCPPSPD